MEEVAMHGIYEELRKLDTTTLLILYILYRIGEAASRKLINKLLAYAVLIDPSNEEFRVLSSDVGRDCRIKHFGWVVHELNRRLEKLADLGLVVLRKDRRRIRVEPKVREERDRVLDVVEKILRDRGFPFDVFVKALDKGIELYKRFGVEELAKVLEQITGIVGTKYALINMNAVEYLELLSALKEEGKRFASRCPKILSVTEFEEIRKRVREPVL